MRIARSTQTTRLTASIIALGLLAGCATDDASVADEADGSVENDDEPDDGDDPSQDEEGASDGSGEAAAAEAEKVTLLLSYLHDVQNSHYYFVQDREWDELCGMDLTIETAADVENPLQLLVGGAVDYALVDPLAYIAAVHNGVPVTAIGADVAVTPVSYASFADAGIEEPADLIGRTVGVEPGFDSEWFLEEILAATLTEEEAEQVNRVPVGYGLESLLTEQVEVKSLWPTNTDVNARIAEGDEFNYIRASDYGITVHGNLIVTTQDRVDEDPESVERFLNVTLAAMEDTLDIANIEEAVESTAERIEDDVDPAVMEIAYEELWEVRTSEVWESNGVGWNDPDGYTLAQELLLENGEIDEELPLDELFTDAFLEAVVDDGQVRDPETLCG